jgi:hypothetical protein
VLAIQDRVQRRAPRPTDPTEVRTALEQELRRLPLVVVVSAHSASVTGWRLERGSASKSSHDLLAQYQRCALPQPRRGAAGVLFVADGWYEWLRAEKKTKGVPPLHLVDGGTLFGMAGLLDVAQVKGDTVPAAMIITTDAVGAAAELHNRMPVVFPDLERQQPWLSPDLAFDDLDELLVPLADGVTTEAVTLPSTSR